MAGRQRRELFDAPGVEGTGADQDRTNAVLRKCYEGRFEIAVCSGIHYNELQAQCPRRRLQVCDIGLDNRNGRVRKNTERAALGINSWSNCNRFGPSSPDKMALPVRFPPGRLRLATRPNATGSVPV